MVQVILNPPYNSNSCHLECVLFSTVWNKKIKMAFNITMTIEIIYWYLKNPNKKSILVFLKKSLSKGISLVWTTSILKNFASIYIFALRLVIFNCCNFIASPMFPITLILPCINAWKNNKGVLYILVTTTDKNCNIFWYVC